MPSNEYRTTVTLNINQIRDIDTMLAETETRSKFVKLAIKELVSKRKQENEIL